MFNKENKREKICLFGVILIFILMSLYRLTDAPLWYDETIEFYYSRYLTGQIPGVSLSNNLYERLQVNSFQPPLYNLIMRVWLIFGESEWWFRFSGVVFGTIGMFGLYACMKKIANRSLACLSVFVSSFIFYLMYYIKEAAEYNMMLMLLYWLLYFYFCAFQELNLKNVGWFTGISVLLLYTQYGAVLAIIPLAVCLFVKALKDNKKKLCSQIALIYLVTSAVAGLPLFFFLFRIQLQMNQSVNYYTVAFEKDNVFYDFVMMLLTTAQWLFTESKTRFYAEFLAALPVFVVMVLLCIIVRRNREFIYYVVSCVAGWILYYVIVRAGIYAYGDFGNRYSLYLLPIWFVLIFYTGYEFYQMIASLEIPYKKLVLRAGVAMILVIQLGYCVYGFYRISIYEGKCDTRSVVRLWYEREGYDVPTYVAFGEAPSFVYYLTHSESYEDEYWENLTFEYENREAAFDSGQYWEYFKEHYNGQPPEAFYLSIGHENALTEALGEQGYRLQEIFRTNTILYYVYK